jgi:16S rRNA (cytosine967-C5)-methyltransferase
MSAYQIVFLERVPAWAAVNDAVALAKTGARRGVPEFVNAALRALSRRGERERRPVLPTDPIDALAVRCSFPTWLAAKWVARYGREEAERVMRSMNERPTMTVRVNTLSTTRERVRERLRLEQGLRAEPARWAPEGLVVEHGGHPGTWKAFVEGDLVVQDEGAMLVSRLLEPRPGETIADVCAAPGTKTTHIATLMGDHGRVLACDPDRARLALVADAAVRLGITIVEPREGPVETVAPTLHEACDRVLVDAPCSNLGVLRRHPDVKWRRTYADLHDAQAHQGAILAAAATMVKPGGWLVYATCSLEPEENDEVWAAFLAAHLDWRPDPPVAFPIALDSSGTLRSTPSDHGTDGFTAIRLRRSRVA